MKKNLGSLDRIVRVLLAVILAALYFSQTVTGTTGIILLIAGLVLLGTSVFSFCPIYWSVGLHSNKVK
jgi:hypothetical protein